MFEGNPTVIDGIEIPYDGTLFLVVLSLHILAGVTGVISGLFAMLSKKKRGLHTTSGNIYYMSLLIVFLTATWIALVRWEEDYHLFILGILSFGGAFIGRLSVKKRWKKWAIYHISGMAMSYIFLLIAFYVDNGRFLPGWKELPPVLYWLLPLAIGIPLLVKTLLTNPLSKDYFRNS